jgi:hypothetical protein
MSDYCSSYPPADPGAITASTAHRLPLTRQAFELEFLALAWMTVEAVVAIGSGIAVDSLTLTAFGIDSVIELASAGLLVWRLSVELRHGQAFAKTAERILAAPRFSCSLCTSLQTASWKLWMQQSAEFSLPGSHRWVCHSDHVFPRTPQAANRQ